VLELVTALVVAFGVVFVAELGDKTQLLALGFGTRHRLSVVAAGLVLGYGAANLLAVVVGSILGAALPDRPIEIIGGLVFLAFAALSVRRVIAASDTDDEPAVEPPPTRRWTGVGSIAVAIAVAEMGDKTQITTATLASQSNPIAVWFGATIGAAASGMVGAAAGRSLGHRISERAVSIGSAMLFAGFGVAMLAGWF
jgi:putative Ca2+/H+ antiporter (TMEM165/GDT1 family)